MRIRSGLRLFALALLAAPELAQAKPLKVFVSVDMEGIAGVVSGEQLGPTGFEYARFREFMTREALAAVLAAKEAGATEVLVADAHGNGQNLLIEQFPADVRVVRSWPRRLGMLGGVDSSFDAVLFVGYHSSTANSEGVRAHTFSSARLARVQLNGADVTEGAFNAAIAGHFGVPVAFISGDDAAIAEVKSQIGPVEAVETKKSLGFHSANSLTPEASCARISAGVKAALARLADFKPYRLVSPITVDVTFKNYRPAEVAAYLRVIQRTGSHSIRFVAKDMLEASDFENFLLSYTVELEP